VNISSQTFSWVFELRYLGVFVVRSHDLIVLRFMLNVHSIVLSIVYLENF